MNTYKAMLQIIKKNRWGFLIIIIINVAVSAFNATSLEESQPLDLTSSKIVIYNHDQGEIGASLESYLASQSTIVTLSEHQKNRDDALYFGKADYLLTIPADFSEHFFTTTAPQLEVAVRPNSFSQSLLTNEVNHYLNTLKAFAQLYPDQSLSRQLAATNKNLQITGQTIKDAAYSENSWRNQSATIYNLLAFGLFGTVFAGITTIYLILNQKEVKQRRILGPMSLKKMNLQIGLGLFFFSLVVLAIFLVYNFLITGSSLSMTTGLFFLSTCLFFVPVVAFSQMIASIAKQETIITVINNVYILGCCFISGVFLPAEYLPQLVKNVAMFTPTYWFVDLNNLIATATYNTEFWQSFLLHGFILFVFACAFVIIGQVLQRGPVSQIPAIVKNENS